MSQPSAMPELPGSLWELPDERGLIRFPRSDGNFEHRPSNSMIPAQHNSKRDAKWRRDVGQAIAETVMGLKVTPHDVQYQLEGFPDGYMLFEQLRQTNDGRSDPYLYGSEHVTHFRSPREFIPHAIWLFTDPNLERKNCKCTYCSGQTQATISQKFGFQTDHHYPSKQRAARPVPCIQPVQRQTSGAVYRPYQAINTIRDTDLRSPQVQSRVREGELVWCSIRPPIQGEQEGQTIAFWPAVIQEIIIRPYSYSSTSSGPLKQYAEGCRVSLLGVNSAAFVETGDILPFLAYDIPSSLRNHLEKLRPAFNEDLRGIYEYEPIPRLPSEHSESRPRTFENAGPYWVALEMCSHAKQYWMTTDPYKHPIPPRNIPGEQVKSGGSHIRFQGLYWGAERIWQGDLVRLNVTFRPGNVGDYLLQLAQNLTPGADTRCLFLRLDSIHYIESKDKGIAGVVRECWMAGPVFETVPVENHHPDADENLHPHEDVTGQPILRPAPILSSPPVLMVPGESCMGDYPLPEAPAGFKFRPVLTEGEELYVNVTCLAGRYYPYLPFSRVLHDQRGKSSILDTCLLSLAGYTPGWVSPMRCKKWIDDRRVMFERAEREAKTDFRRRLDRQIQ